MDEQRLILVVEDDEATRAFLLENLAADGFRVAGASSAGEGVRGIEVRRPSLVILDLALEAGSGLALLDRVRHADGLASRIDPDLPVIVLTGRVGEADRVRSFARGADDYVPKPTRSFVLRAGDVFRAALPRSVWRPGQPVREIARFGDQCSASCSSSIAGVTLSKRRRPAFTFTLTGQCAATSF